MQEEVNQKTVSLIIQSGKLTASELTKALKYLLAELQKDKSKVNTRSTATPQKSKARKGKQTLAQLRAQGKDLTNIQVTNQNIGSFGRIARKYCVDYALKKDKTTKPPTYYVFFKAKDVDAMTAAFKEYCNVSARKQARPSVRRKLAKAMETVRSTRSQQKERNKHQERSR